MYSQNLYNIKESNVKIPTKEKNNCLHSNCKSCNGTGIKIDGGVCIHNIVCNCPKCSIR